ncbi:hypothetical protein EYR40_005760 [Pleurotus pulmonarius]|nr:hypothetical protein EYR40_005760 [Pleurotus pulmonarius]
MHAALTQVLGGLWAFILSMIACLTGRCAHSSFKSELPVVALYEDKITRQRAPKAAGIPVSAYGATSVEARTNGGFGALFNDSGEELDNKEVGTAIDDTETMKNEWSKLLKQGSESSSSDEDGEYSTFASLEYNADNNLLDDLYFFSSYTTKKPSPEPGQFHDRDLSSHGVERVPEDIGLVDVSSPPLSTGMSATNSPLPTLSSFEAFEKFQMFRFPLGPGSPDCPSPMFSPGPWYEEFESKVAASGSEFSPTTPMTINIGKRGAVMHDYGDFDRETLQTPGPFRRGYQWSRDVV